MTINKNAITTRAMVITSKRFDEAGALLTDVGVTVGIEVEDDGVEVGLKGVFAGMLIVCVLLQSLV
jgi:hypothetical protein